MVFSEAEGTLTIRLLITGGTFDKEYDEMSGRLYFKDTHVQEMLRLGRCRMDVEVRTVMMVDSLEMTDADRRIDPRQLPAGAARKRIVITHGTDTMVETAQVLAAGVPDKTIVLTGAMVPYAFGSSDGLFNLGSALSFVQVLPPGVYIAMNGRCFPWDRVRKNTSLGYFEEIPERLRTRVSTTGLLLHLKQDDPREEELDGQSKRPEPVRNVGPFHLLGA